MPYRINTILADNGLCRAHFMAAYNFARRLKTLSGLTPYEYIVNIWTSEPGGLFINPIDQMPELNINATYLKAHLTASTLPFKKEILAA